MSGEIETVPVEQRKRRPIPIFEDRFTQRKQYSRETPYIDLSRPYLRKNILAEIGNNLNELVNIKTGGINDNNQSYIKPVTIHEEKKIEKPFIMVEERKIEEKKPEEKKVEVPISLIPNVTHSPEITKDVNKNDIKIGINKLEIANIIPEKKIENEKIKFEIKQTENKHTENKEKLVENKKKIIKRKVNYMSDEENQINLSPDDRRRMRKAEMKDFQEEEETSKNIRESADLVRKNQGEIENLKFKLDENKLGIQKDLDIKFGNLDIKFGNLDSKFVELGTKLKETCDGIDCIKKDIKKQELAECPECGKERVPHLASFCPECGFKMKSWTEDDGTPIKGWKPNWQKEKQE